MSNFFKTNGLFEVRIQNVKTNLTSEKGHGTFDRMFVWETDPVNPSNPRIAKAIFWRHYTADKRNRVEQGDKLQRSLESAMNRTLKANETINVFKGQYVQARVQQSVEGGEANVIEFLPTRANNFQMRAANTAFMKGVKKVLEASEKNNKEYWEALDCSNGFHTWPATKMRGGACMEDISNLCSIISKQQPNTVLTFNPDTLEWLLDSPADNFKGFSVKGHTDTPIARVMIKRETEKVSGIATLYRVLQHFDVINAVMAE